ncbi:MAG: glycosyltransferase [Syntrophaceae bacterium]|nr:glycosyltransferase [Syntrophaceae bacterium]
MLTLADAISKYNVDVTVVSLSSKQAYPIPDGVNLLLVEDRYRGPFYRQTEIRRRALQLDRALNKYYEGRTLDLAISNLPMADRIVAASAYLQDAWMCLHGAVATVQLKRRKGIRRLFKRIQLQRTYSGRKLITVSEGLKSEITELAGARPERIVTIPNPFDFESIRKLSQQNCPLEGERFVIHVGRFRAVKRHDRLFEAFLLSKYPGKLVLLGEESEEMKRELRRLCCQMGIENRVIFSGFQSNPYPYLRAAEVLLSSSDYEGFGNALVEALACGTPVVSTDCPYGPREILKGDLVRGLSKLSAESMAECLNDVLENPPLITAEQLERFSIERVVAQYLELAGHQMV